MGRVMNAIRAFFDEDDWTYTQLEDRPILRMGFTGDDGHWTCYAQAREEQQQFVFYSVLPLKTPADRRTAMAEFLTRANYGMIIGNFELDLADGEIRYKTAIDIEHAVLTYPLAKHLVYANVLTVDRYLKGILAVAFGGVSPLEALESVEAPF